MPSTATSKRLSCTPGISSGKPTTSRLSFTPSSLAIALSRSGSNPMTVFDPAGLKSYGGNATEVPTFSTPAFWMEAGRSLKYGAAEPSTELADELADELAAGAAALLEPQAVIVTASAAPVIKSPMPRDRTLISASSFQQRA